MNDEDTNSSNMDNHKSNINKYNNCEHNNKDTQGIRKQNRKPKKQQKGNKATTKLINELSQKIQAHPGISIGHLNTRSLMPKVEDVELLLLSSKMDILTLSETWLDQSIQPYEIKVDGYNTIRKDRNRHGGGVMIYIREEIDYTERHDLEHDSIEATWIEVPNLLRKEKTLICSYYRPPDKTSEYLEDTLDMMNKAANENKEMIICGDFNWNYNFDEDLANNQVKQIEDLFLLMQIIDKPTRTEYGDKILDLILTSSPNNHIYTNVLPLGCSDHYLPYSIINTTKPLQCHRQAKIRSYKDFNEELFLADLLKQRQERNISSHETHNKQSELNKRWETWKDDFITISNKHAPLRTVRMRPHCRSWITTDIIKIMNKRDEMKTTATKSKKTEDWKSYRNLRNKVNKLIKEEKKKHYENTVQLKMGNTKFWKEMTKLIPNKLDMSSIPKSLTLDELNTYFSEIGNKITSEVEKKKKKSGLIWKSPSCIYDFVIKYITEESVATHLQKLKLTTNTDIIGMDCKLLRLGSHIIAKDLSDIINLSVESDTVPQDWKIARVTPIYKGKGCKDDPSNYRPISVVCHVSKVFEKLISMQFVNYLNSHNLISEYQSAYLKECSTQTSLHKIIDDIYESMDEGEITAACFIDITKCFDSIDHELLLRKLKKHGIKKNIDWFKSYLSNRQQRIIHNGKLSETKEIKAGVPQGSVLGPFLFILFANDIGNFIGNGQINCYADDAVIYVQSTNINDAKQQLQNCINAVEEWYTENKLKVNVMKTEVMLLGTPQKISKVKEEDFCVKFGTKTLKVVKEFKYLGVQLDGSLNWNKHCELITRKSGLKLHLMRRLSKILQKETMVQIYKTYMMPILEYAATVWGYTSEQNINKVQRIINMCARIVHQNYDFINSRGADILKELKWNTFKERRDFLLSVLMYKCHQGDAPATLTDKLTLQNMITDRATRYSDVSTYHIPRTRTRKAEAAFRNQGPLVWNKIPLNIREASSLKTFKRLYKKEILGLTN